MNLEGEKFLRETAAKEIFADFTEIVILQDTDSISTAIDTLSKKNISSAPVVSSIKGNVVGCIDLLDLVTFTCAKLGNDRVDLYTSEKQAKEFSKPIADILNISGRNPWTSTSYKTSLAEIVGILSQRDCHRVAVKNEVNDLVGLVTQSKVIEFLSHHTDKMGELMKKKVSELWKMTDNVHSINVHRFVIDAFNIICEKGISGIAVVDDDGELCGNLSAGDLKRIQLTPPMQLVYDIYEQIGNFINVLDTSKMSNSEKSQKTFMASLPSFAPVFATPDTTVEELLHLFTSKHIHRVYVVESKTHKKPIHVISLGDAISKFQLPPAPGSVQTV